ncbi:MAG: carbamoyltransferase [Acidobacteria bacterium]|nr:MAG: carbamoyltransferase [Acidobacteriota bacterium]
MKILGFSGLESSVPFKKAHWPGLDEREYRISQGHDSAAALVIDGVCVAAAAEERFNRKKHTGDFPISAIGYCLAEGGISLENVDEIAHGFDYAPYRKLYSLDPTAGELYQQVFSNEALFSSVHRHLPEFPPERIHPVEHHLAHAASAYCTSGWDDCLVVVIDGMGEAHSASVYRASNGRLERLHQISALDSIGILYSLITLHLGFEFNADEYKIMGLAPYGDPARYRCFFEKAVVLNGNGSIRVPLLRLNRTRDERENYKATRKFLEENLVPARHPDAEIRDEHRDVAAALQERLDKAMVHLCGHFARRTGLRHLAMAGGVALNCTANGKLLDSGIFDEIYIQPAAGDDGTALGAALYRGLLARAPRQRRFPVPFLGPAHPMDVIESALAEFAERIEVTRFSTLDAACEEAARRIAAGKVVAWYRGRMEFGPRALGNRSILADPGHPEMRDRVNAMVKMREAFRPFAPAVSLEQAHLWFDIAPMTELPYMIFIARVREAYRAQLPAVTHVDGSARVQTVSRKDNADFHALLRAVGKLSGREMVLNTSFNVKGQPIVNTPAEAIETFLGTGIDCLFLENLLLQRRITHKGETV